MFSQSPPPSGNVSDKMHLVSAGEGFEGNTVVEILTKSMFFLKLCSP